jgi:hypothetical protein
MSVLHRLHDLERHSLVNNEAVQFETIILLSVEGLVVALSHLHDLSVGVVSLIHHIQLHCVLRLELVGNYAYQVEAPYTVAPLLVYNY